MNGRDYGFMAAAVALFGVVIAVMALRIAGLNAEVAKGRQGLKAAEERLKIVRDDRDLLVPRVAECEKKLLAMTKPPEPGSLESRIGDLADGIVRMGCMVERIEYRAELENRAELPHGWLADNVFGAREVPDFASMTKLTTKQKRALLKAFAETPYPTCEAE